MRKLDSALARDVRSKLQAFRKQAIARPATLPPSPEASSAISATVRDGAYQDAGRDTKVERIGSDVGGFSESRELAEKCISILQTGCLTNYTSHEKSRGNLGIVPTRSAAEAREAQDLIRRSSFVCKRLPDYVPHLNVQARPPSIGAGEKDKLATNLYGSSLNVSSDIISLVAKVCSGKAGHTIERAEKGTRDAYEEERDEDTGQVDKEEEEEDLFGGVGAWQNPEKVAEGGKGGSEGKERTEGGSAEKLRQVKKKMRSAASELEALDGRASELLEEKKRLLARPESRDGNATYNPFSIKAQSLTLRGAKARGVDVLPELLSSTFRPHTRSDVRAKNAQGCVENDKGEGVEGDERDEGKMTFGTKFQDDGTYELGYSSGEDREQPRRRPRNDANSDRKNSHKKRRR